MSDSNKSTGGSGGVTTIGLLGVLFVALKLTGLIDWSWWWVTAPFWGGLALAGLIVLSAVFTVTAISLLRVMARAMKAQGAGISEWFRERKESKR